VLRLDDRVAGAFEALAQRPSDQLPVVDDEDAAGGGAFIPSSYLPLSCAA
jgi:hypothetical protein